MPRKITTVFFDLGNTLIYPAHDWQPVYQAADRALFERLTQLGCRLNFDSFLECFLNQLEVYYSQRDVDLSERGTASVLQSVLAQQGCQLPADQIPAAIDVMYAVTRQNWLLEEDAIQTLQALQQQGYRLGMISNASSGDDVRALLEMHAIGSFFDPIIISADLGIRKPHPAIFKAALQVCQTLPEQAVMIGDRLGADILGARHSGLASIWITRRVESEKRARSADIQPDGCVGTLSELPDLLARWQADNCF